MLRPKGMTAASSSGSAADSGQKAEDELSCGDGTNSEDATVSS